MKEHISSSKQLVKLHSQGTCTCVSKSEYDFSAIEELRKQMYKLQNQLVSLISQKSAQSTTCHESHHNASEFKLQVLLPHNPSTSLGVVLSVASILTLLPHARMRQTQI